MTGTGLSKIFDIQHNHFLFVSCEGWGYVEVSDPNVLYGKEECLVRSSTDYSVNAYSAVPTAGQSQLEFAKLVIDRLYIGRAGWVRTVSCKGVPLVRPYAFF